MFKTSGTEFVRICNAHTRFYEIAKDVTADNLNTQIKDNPQRITAELLLAGLKASYDSAGADQCSAQIEAVLRGIPLGYTWFMANNQLWAAFDGFQKYIGEFKCLILNKSERELYESARPFGEAVWSNFETAREDVSAAAQCLALEQYGASAFHALRAAEVPLKASLKMFRVTISGSKSWGGALNAIQPVAFAPVPRHGRVTDENQFGRALCGYMESLKKIRDSRVMHIGELPDMDTSRALFSRIKDMMQHVAAHLNELGVFTP